MFKPEQYLNATINDIVFENRNKNYGAYQLRKDAGKVIFQALLFGFLATGVIAAITLRSVATHDGAPPIVEIVADVKEIIMPDLDLPKPQPVVEQPPAAEPVAQQPTVEFTTMNVVDDKTATAKDPVAVSDLKDRVISTTTNDLPPGIKGPVMSTPPAAAPKPKEDEIKNFAEVAPQFPNGFEGMQKFIAKHVEYSSYAMREGIEGTVYVSLVINTDGSVSNVKIERGVGFGLDEAAMDVVKMMPNWIPGMQNGNKVRVRQVIPIKFELTGD